MRSIDEFPTGLEIAIAKRGRRRDAEGARFQWMSTADRARKKLHGANPTTLVRRRSRAQGR